VRSIKYECLDRIVPLGERHLRRTLTEFVDHYHRERNHQGLEIGSSSGARLFTARDKFVGVRGSVACSIITSERRDNQCLRPDLPLGPDLGHYGLVTRRATRCSPRS
jgi:hypothetical protein